MFSRILPDRFIKTLSFRLTFSYSALFAVIASCGFLSLYLCLYNYMHGKINEEITGEFCEFRQIIENESAERVYEFFQTEAASEDSARYFYRLIDSFKILIAFYDKQIWPVATMDSLLSSVYPDGGERLDTIDTIDEIHDAKVITGVLPSGRILQIGFLIDEESEMLDSIGLYSGIILLCLLIASIIVGRNISRIAVQGINDVTQTANNIAEGAIDKRVPVSKYGRELENLGVTFNRMADKISTLLSEMKEINDNIAHDLRSPLARMRGLAEEKISQKNASEDCFRICEDVIEDCDILLHVINTMLDISEMESGMASLQIEAFDLSDILFQTVDSFLPVAQDKNIHFHSSIDGTAMVMGDRRKIQRSISNLIDNAIKYTNAGGEIGIKLSTDRSFARIVISDTGIGVSERDKQKIFQRFYRGSKSRTHQGNGLGLSLAASVARAHGGRITVESNEGEGSVFTFSVPASETA